VNVGINSMDLEFEMYVPNKYINMPTKSLKIKNMEDVKWDAKTIRKEFREAKKSFYTSVYDKYGVKPQDIRCYNHINSDFNAVVIRTNDNKHIVTFSFVNKRDFMSALNCLTIDKRELLTHDISKISRTATFKNYLDNKYTYTIDDCNNSMNAVVRAFNLYKGEFPNNRYYKYLKLRVAVSTHYKK
jgi:hypothetical protein